MLLNEILNIRPDLSEKLKDRSELITILKKIVFNEKERRKTKDSMSLYEKIKQEEIKISKFKEFERKHYEEILEIDPTYADQFMSPLIYIYESLIRSTIDDILKNTETEHYNMYTIKDGIIHTITDEMVNKKLSELTGSKLTDVKQGISDLTEYKLIEKRQLSIPPEDLDFYKIVDNGIFTLIEKHI